MVLAAPPHGDAAAARALAAAFRRTADTVAGQRAVAASTLDGLAGAWHGTGQGGLATPWQRLDESTTRAVSGLRETAHALERYATALDDAHARHRWSWRRIAAVGLTVAVVAGAVVVTGGAAIAASSVAAEEVAAGIAAAEGATALAAEAAAGAGAALSETAGLAAAVRGLAALVLPHLAMGVVSGGSDLLVQELRGDDVRWDGVAVSFGVGALGSAGTSAALARSGLAELSPAARFLATHLTVGGIAATGDVAAQLLTSGDVDWTEAAETGGVAALLSGGTDLARGGWHMQPIREGTTVPATVSPEARVHILDGDAETGAGDHRYGTRFPGKTEFPADWSDERIIRTVEDVANDPASLVRRGRWGRYDVIGTRDGIRIFVVVENPFAGGGVVTAYPPDTPPNPR
jgi:uncharacterized protein YukE